MATILAMLHDVLLVVGLASLAGHFLGWEVDALFLTALLTIIGFSVHDSIVVFDRVRENARAQRREPLETVVNTAVNQTLSRTIITAGTTFLAVLSLYLFGGEVLEGFAFTMLVGIVSGTYSTVFIASAIAIILGGKQTPAASSTAAKATASKAAAGRRA